MTALTALPPAARLAALESLKESLAALSPQSSQPIGRVRWVPIYKVTPNDYNPNSVARTEMGLLYTSILHDGYTQPIVTIHDADRDLYVIVDGFHRYFTMKSHAYIRERCNGLLPVVVIDKPLNDRMASTVRHNRARGKHSIQGMSSMVFDMLKGGWKDADICNELGMSPEELVRLKHITGFSKLFKDAQYSQAWETDNMVRERKKHAAQDRAASPDAG